MAAGAGTDLEKAIKIHGLVRDQILFGWAREFYDQKAPGVLRAGIGFCNKNSTLFMALLWAAGIPARQHFISISAKVLEGFIDPGSESMYHSFTEVRIGEARYRVDSYDVDRPLGERSRARLRDEGNSLGYGAHRNGVSEWDGRSDASSQFVNDGTAAEFSDATMESFRMWEGSTPRDEP